MDNDILRRQDGGVGLVVSVLVLCHGKCTSRERRTCNVQISIGRGIVTEFH